MHCLFALSRVQTNDVGWDLLSTRVGAPTVGVGLKRCEGEKVLGESTSIRRVIYNDGGSKEELEGSKRQREKRQKIFFER
jgi:hypothetical protein